MSPQHSSPVHNINVTEIKHNLNANIPNQHVINAMISSLNNSHSNDISTSELDSHANMVVLGKDAFIFESTGRTCNVEPFPSDLGVAENIPIVDATIANDCDLTHETYILIIRNALHIPSMIHNLLPPFILRQAGLTVNDTAKIHCKDPSPDDHCITFPDSELRIPLKLNGIFSYFNSRKPMPSELYGKDKLFITPDSTEWNPNCLSFAANEDSMTDHEGLITDVIKRSNGPIQLLDNPDDILDLASVTVKDWDSAIDSNISECYVSEALPDHERQSRYDLDADFHERISLRGEICKYILPQ